MTSSMSRPANPSDNATCESFMKTLKQEEIHCRDYRDIEDLEAHLEEFLDRYYNGRLHSALGYRTPEEFEKECAQPGPDDLADAPKMSLFRHRKSTDPIAGRETAGSRHSVPRSHRLDEFPAGYPSRGCSPAEPASVFPDRDILIDCARKVIEDYSERGTAFIARVSPQVFTPLSACILVHLRPIAFKLSPHTIYS